MFFRRKKPYFAHMRKVWLFCIQEKCPPFYWLPIGFGATTLSAGFVLLPGPPLPGACPEMVSELPGPVNPGPYSTGAVVSEGETAPAVVSDGAGWDASELSMVSDGVSPSAAPSDATGVSPGAVVSSGVITTPEVFLKITGACPL